MATNAEKKRRNDQAQREITRLWGDVPVVDAGKDLRVIVQPCDVTKATAKDPGCCVFAQACKRSFGAKKVLFFRGVAYVELPQDDGQMQVERFILSHPMRELISNFDQGNPVLPKAGFVLQAPKPGQTLEAMAAAKKKRKEALLMGTATKRGNSGKGSGAKRYSKIFAVDLEVRSGTGHVHFAAAKSK